MKVHAIAADAGGCGHYRLIWPLEALDMQSADLEVNLVLPERAGSEFDTQLRCRADVPPPANDNMLARYLADGTAAIVGLNAVPDADLVIMQRPLTRQLVEVIRLLQARGLAVAVETDDDFETIHRRNIAHRTVHPAYEFRNGGRSWEHLAAAAELADLVIVSTPALAARYGRHGRVAVVRNYVPRRYLYVRPRLEPGSIDAAVKVGWSGSVNTHPADLQVTRGAVGNVLRKHRLPMHVIGEHDTRVAAGLDLRDVPLAHTRGWLELLTQYPRGMALLDVGIVPLELSTFNEAKSWLKGLEWAALGVPFIASPTGEYCELERRGAGVIAAKPRDWLRHLDRLVGDDDHRATLAAAGRETARGLLVEDHVDEHLAAYRQALDNSTRRTDQ